MIWSPLLPGALLLLLALASLAAWWWAYGRPSVPAVLRLVALGVLAAMLLEPTVITPLTAPRAGPVLVVVDGSGSMERQDSDGRTRLTAATEDAHRLRNALGPEAQIWTLRANGLAPGIPDIADGDTDFTPLAEFAQAPFPPRALFLLSDGADWRGSQPEPALARSGIAVHTLGYGNRTPLTNAAVVLTPLATTAAPGQEMTLTLTVTASPDLVGSTARVVVEDLDAPAGTPPLHDVTAGLAPSGTWRLTAPAGTATGSRVWRARLLISRPQATVADDVGFAAIQVVPDQVRLCLLEGLPNWDTTFALRAWRRDRRLEVSAHQAVGSRARRTGTPPALPLSAAGLAPFQVIVLGGRSAELLGPTAKDVLTTWVDQGGGLLLLADNPFPDLDPLERLPTSRPRVLGPEDSPIAGLLPPKSTVTVQVSAGSALKPQSRLLLGSRSAPVAAVRRLGRGWVASCAATGFWSWQMTPEAGSDPGERLWRQVLQACTGTPRGPLTVERTDLSLGEDLVAWLDPDRPTQARLTIVGPQDHPTHPRHLPTTEHRAVFRPDVPGLWRLRLGEDTASVVVNDRSREVMDAQRDDARLARLADATQGTAHADVESALQAARRLNAATTQERVGEERRTTITHPGWFLAVIACLTLEWWWRRRRWGAV